MKSTDILPNSWREWRRLRTVQLKQAGWRQRDIAAALGVPEVTVSRWLARAREGGIEALLDHPSPGRPPRLSASQRALIPELLWHGPEAYGFRGRVWTCARIAKGAEDIPSPIQYFLRCSMTAGAHSDHFSPAMRYAP